MKRECRLADELDENLDEMEECCDASEKGKKEARVDVSPSRKPKKRKVITESKAHGDGGVPSRKPNKRKVITESEAHGDEGVPSWKPKKLSLATKQELETGVLEDHAEEEEHVCEALSLSPYVDSHTRAWKRAFRFSEKSSPRFCFVAGFPGKMLVYNRNEPPVLVDHPLMTKTTEVLVYKDGKVVGLRKKEEKRRSRKKEDKRRRSRKRD